MPDTDTPALSLSPLDATRVEQEKIETPYRGYARVERHTLKHPRFDGSLSPSITREIFVSGDAVMVIPFDPADESVLLIEQFRMGPLHRGDHPWILEAIAGRIEPGETPADVARREAMEEAGAQVSDLVEMGGYFLSPGIVAEHMTFFCARADLSGASGIHGLDEEAEDIRAIKVPLDEALRVLDGGEMVSAPTALALLWMARHRARLLEAWRP